MAADTTRMTARMVGQCAASATCTARESEPSAALPISQATYPPKRERHAEPDPWRAMRDRSVGESGSSYRSAMARTRAAKPAAEDASPAAVGKLFSETMCTLYSLSFGRAGFTSSSFLRRALSSRKQACWRAPETSWDSLLR